MFTSTSNMSNVCREITDNVHGLKKGAQATVGKGRNTLFQDHSWATDDPLRELITQPVPNDLEGAIMEELWEVGNSWKQDSIANLLPQNSLKG